MNKYIIITVVSVALLLVIAAVYWLTRKIEPFEISKYRTSVDVLGKEAW